MLFTALRPTLSHCDVILGMACGNVVFGILRPGIYQ